MATVFTNHWLLRKIFYRIEDLFTNPSNPSFNAQRPTMEIPTGAYNVSVEMALNSRCTSDYDGNQYKFHWGLFDDSKTISDDQIKEIVDLATVPHFTNERVQIRNAQNILSFVIDGEKQGLIREHMMIESGMQQQAVGLVCSALGVGMAFNSFSKDGRTISNADYENIEIKLNPMKPSHGTSYWTDIPPDEDKSLRRDNLSNPLRNGNKNLLSALRELRGENPNGQIATQESIGQLLWAARGRTPHLYKSKPWGMTIPTWGGEQNITSVYLIFGGILSRYVNWRWNGWAHSIESLREVGEELQAELYNLLPPHNCLIVLGRNEHFARSYWEVGYQALNLMLQAKSLNLSYRLLLVNEKQKDILLKIGIKDPAAALFTTHA